LDAVLNMLVGSPPAQVPEARAEAPVQDGVPGQKRSEKNVRDPLYSSELIDERAGMLKHLTGFDRAEVDKLIIRFREVRFIQLHLVFRLEMLVDLCSCVVFDLLRKVEKGIQPEKPKANAGYKKVKTIERVLLFLTRLWRKPTFRELGYHYGCGRETAREYFNYMVKIFREHFVPRLVFPRSPAELRKMTSEQVRKAFPDLLAILDATNWEQLKPENFLVNRMSWSAYKHATVFQVLLGELVDWLECDSSQFMPCFSCCDQPIDFVVIGNLWRDFQRDFGVTGPIYSARANGGYGVWFKIELFFFIFLFCSSWLLGQTEG
jgi:hypothetical protein